MGRETRSHDDEDDSEILEGRYRPLEATVVENGRVSTARVRMLRRPLHSPFVRFVSPESELPGREFPVVCLCNGGHLRFMHKRRDDGRYLAYCLLSGELWEIALPDGRRFTEDAIVCFNSAGARPERPRRGELLAREPLQPVGPHLVFGLATREPDGRLSIFYVAASPRVKGFKAPEIMRQAANVIYATTPELARYAAQRVAAGAKRTTIALARCDGARLADVERFELVRAMREGHPCLNFRYLSTPEAAQLGDEIADERVTGSDDLARRRERAQRRRARAETLLAAWAIWGERQTSPATDTRLQIALSRSFPVLWRRLIARDTAGELDLPLVELDPGEALAMLVEQARAARRPLPLRYPGKFPGTGTHGENPGLTGFLRVFS